MSVVCFGFQPSLFFLFLRCPAEARRLRAENEGLHADLSAWESAYWELNSEAKRFAFYLFLRFVYLVSVLGRRKRCWQRWKIFIRD
jgi:hypothetical protein